MTTCKIHGPRIGETFAIQVDQDGQSDTTQIGAFGANASVNVRLTRQPFRTAPERVSIEVNGWSGFLTPAGDPDGYEPRLHRIIYYVEFGEPGSVYQAPDNVLASWCDRNKGFGPLTAHVYRSPGTYKIQLWAYEIDSDRRAYWEQEVTVEDPDLTFAGSDVYVSAAGDFSNAPGNVAGTYTSLSAAYEARKPFPITRFILKSGETHTNHGQLYIDFETGGLRNAAHFVTDGDAPVAFVHDPTVTSGVTYAFRVCAGRDNPHPNAEVVFQNIDVQGHWDDVTETGPALQNGWGDFAGRYHLNHFLLDKCAARNCNAGFASDGAAVDEDPEVTLHDFVVERFRDIGVWGGGVPRFNFLGCRIMRGVDASSGGPKGGPPYHNNHGPIRLNSYTKNRVVIDGCDLFSRSGWFVNVAGWRSQQPCIRVNQGSVPGSIFNLQRTSMEGGYYIISLTRMSNVVNTGIHNSIVDKFVMVGSHGTTAGISADSGGITVRNGLFIVPDVPRIDLNFETTSLISTQIPYNNAPAIHPTIELWHNTIINKMSDANSPTGDGSIVDILNAGGMTDIRRANNLIHQPDAQNHVATMNIGQLSAEQLWEPREQGYISKEQPVLATQFETPNDTVSKSSPMDSLDIIGNASEEPESHFDIHGNFRPEITSIGAMEKDR